MSGNDSCSVSQSQSGRGWKAALEITEEAVKALFIPASSKHPAPAGSILARKQECVGEASHLYLKLLLASRKWLRFLLNKSLGYQWSLGRAWLGCCVRMGARSTLRIFGRGCKGCWRKWPLVLLGGDAQWLSPLAEKEAGPGGAELLLPTMREGMVVPSEKAAPRGCGIQWWGGR